MKNRKRIVKAIRLTISSLESHLDWTIRKPTKKERKAASGSRKFHVRAGKEYGKVIMTLLKQL